jgi:glycosyltransferase involved in cell wall biosynthesis
VRVSTALTPLATALGSRTLTASTDAPRPRVALVGSRPDSRGGVATTIRLLQNSRLAAEFDLILVATHRDGTMTTKALEAARGLIWLMRLCATRNVNLVHVHASAGPSLARKSLAIGIARATGVPVVLHVHGGSGFHAELERRTVLARLERRAIRWALESSEVVVALTPGWERRLAARGRMRRSCVIANAADLAFQTGKICSGRKRLVLFLGHLYRDKGVYDLLEAFAKVKATRPDVRLVLAGVGSEAHGLRSQADRLGLGPAVELPGWVGPTAKVELLTSAACLVLPSHHEGLPLAVLEAMLARVPIVATAVGGVPDVLENGRHAILVQPNDVGALTTALARVLDDREFAKRLSDAAQRRARAEYTPEALAKRVGELYREVLASR